MKTILVPTDFSKGAGKALDYAIEFVKKQKATLIILHSYSVNYPVAETPLYIVDEIQSDAKAESDLSLKNIENSVSEAGIEYQLISLEGAPSDIIPRYAKEQKTDLIIMGTQGVNAISNRLFGSTTARVMEKAYCPVIAVPENSTFHPIKKITYATNYDKQDIKNLKQVVEFAALSEAQVDILHIADEGMSSYYDKTTMQKFMDNINRQILYKNLTFQILSGVDLVESFGKYIDSKSTDLLILATHHHTFLERIFGRSLTKQLATHLNVPVMAFHNPIHAEADLSTPSIHLL